MKIEIKHLEKKFPDGTPLKDVNATVNDGDVVAIIGPSGTGKSTLMRCINMLDPPTKGEIYIDGLEITQNKANFEKVRQRIGMVFQSFNLFNHLTVIENVMFALRELKKMSKQEAYDIAIEKIREVGLEEHILKYPDDLSGGQKQRVSIARTLAMDPDLILLDEPTSALDPTMVREVESVICKLAKTGKTMMIVTHEMRLAKAISNRIFYLDQGVLYEDGTPDEVFNHPKRERTLAFVNNLKVYKHKFTTADFDYDRFNMSFNNYIDNNEFDSSVKIKLKTALETVATEIVPNQLGETVAFSIVAEFSPETKSTKLIVYYSKPKNDIKNEIECNLSSIVTSLETVSIEDKDYSYKTSCII